MAGTKNKAIMLSDLIGIMSEKYLDQPLHLQVYSKIKEAIMKGALPAHTKLPSSRSLAIQLKHSRNTVLAAYEQLIAEGFLSTRHGSGTYVTELSLPAKAIDDGHGYVPVLPTRTSQLKPDSRLGFAGLKLFPGFPDPILFPQKLWNRLQSHAAQSLDQSLREVSLTNGHRPLLEALARHLAIARGVNVEPDQIFITAGASQSVNLITRAVADRNSTAWVEEPGYQVIVQSLRLSDMKLKHIPVDEHGMDVEIGEKNGEPPKIIYVTTSYQYPLGYTMSIERRLRLLEIARKHESWIIEDDYDGEFRYRGKPIPALFGLEGNASTIYLGTFSKAFSPSIRTSFLVAPRSLVPTLQALYPTYGNVSSIAVQAALSELVSKGFFAKHIEQVRQAYGSRRFAMEQALLEHCNIETKVVGALPGGLHIAVGLTGIKNEHEILHSAARLGIGCFALSSEFAEEKARIPGLLLGFTSTNEQIIEQSIAEIAKIVHHSGARFILPKDISRQNADT